MNKIAEDFASGAAVVGVFCNQFGFQTNEGPAETLKILADVRPGNGFVPKMDLYSKVNVNGAAADPLFKWMRSVIKIPQDPPGDSKGNGCDDVDLIISPRSAFDGVTLASWSPVTRTDVAWNFEKFLFSKDGELVKRYSRYYSTEAIAADIQKLL
jgi:glutathione peroxidase